jgi:hypothetical protein
MHRRRYNETVTQKWVQAPYSGQQRSNIRSAPTRSDRQPLHLLSRYSSYTGQLAQAGQELGSMPASGDVQVAKSDRHLATKN